jgi:hypothetical protein
MPLLQHIPSQVALHLTNSDGEEYFLIEEQLSWQTRIVQPGKDAVWTRWEDADTMLNSWDEPHSYDPRQETWYQETMADPDGTAVIFPPSLEPLSEVRSIVGATRWTDGTRTWVASLHVDLRKMLSLLAILSMRTEGVFGLVSEISPFVLFPTSMPEKTSQNSLGDAAQQQIEHEMLALVAHWENVDEESPPIESFTAQDIVWWTGARALHLPQQTVWVVLALPEVESPIELRQQRQFILTTVVSALLGILVLIGIQGRFVRKILRELDAQQQQLTADEAGDLTHQIQQGESLTQEFKSTLRWNLKTNKADKNLELAWLKTVAAYLNTKGGCIFLGVRDDGEILGLDADQFKNADKLLLHVNNLVKQHIGLEFSNYITVELHTLNARDILLITCVPSKAPVFLKHNQQEHFYIRTGPSSTKLSGSEMLKYLENRAE